MAMLLNKPAVGAGIIMTWNFAGRIVDIPVQRAKNDGTYWVGGITGTPLLQHLMTQKAKVYLRINGRQDGEASLTNVPAVLRETMRTRHKPLCWPLAPHCRNAPDPQV